MQIVIEYYRTRQEDDAHAVVGRETAQVADLDDAVQVARLLLHTLEMPQRPDAMTISDASGTALYSSLIDARGTNEEDHEQR